MNKIYFLTLLLLSFLLNCKTNKTMVFKYNEKIELFPIGKNGMWGYADDNGDIKIPYQFQKVSFFDSGRASVKSNGKFGFINTQGKFVTKPKYDSIGYFNDEKAIVVKNGKKSTIYRNGKKSKEGIVIQSCGYGSPVAYSFNSDDYFDKINGKYVLNSKEQTTIKRLNPRDSFSIDDYTYDNVTLLTYERFIVEKNKKFGIYIYPIGVKGVWADEIIPSKDLSNIKYRNGDKWGIISYDGFIFIKATYFSINYNFGSLYLAEYKPNCFGYLTYEKLYFKME